MTKNSKCSSRNSLWSHSQHELYNTLIAENFKLMFMCTSVYEFFVISAKSQSLTTWTINVTLESEKIQIVHPLLLCGPTIMLTSVPLILCCFQKILAMATGSLDYPTKAILERIAERVNELDVSSLSLHFDYFIGTCPFVFLDYILIWSRWLCKHLWIQISKLSSHRWELTLITFLCTTIFLPVYLRKCVYKILLGANSFG